MTIRWPRLLATLATAAVVMAFVAYVDRPVADFANTLWGTGLVTWATRLLAPLPVLFIAGIVLALVTWGLGRSGRTSWPWARTLQLSIGSAALALLLAQTLKLLIGRSDAYPTWVVSRIYEFHLLHGAPGYSSFPSATTAAVSAFLTIYWLRKPAVRLLCALALAAVAGAIIVANGHWASDVVAGGFLGALIARDASRIAPARRTERES
jgi:membrane-associated phospholipid phosphatase